MQMMVFTHTQGYLDFNMLINRNTYIPIGCFILPKVFIFTSIVIFPISYVPQVNLNQKYWIKIEIYYGSKPIKVLYYELLRGKKDAQILLQKSMKE